MSQFPDYPSGYETSSYSPISPAPPPVKTSGLAIASLLFGIGGLLTCCAMLFGIVGLVLGIAALPPIKRGEAQGRSLAIAGIVLSIIGLVVGAALWLLLALSPDNTPVSGPAVTAKQRNTLQAIGALKDGETIEMFCCSGMFSIKEGGVVLTDGRLVIYGKGTQIQECRLADIAGIDFTPAENWLSDGQFVLDLDDGRIFTFTIDGLEAGDKLFHRTLSRLVEEARKKAGKSAMKAGAEATE